VDGNRVILKGYDAVAFFEQGKPVKGNPTIKSSYQGATYLFASEADKTAFDKEPARYAPQYVGFCLQGSFGDALICTLRDAAVRQPRMPERTIRRAVSL
jgi:YHS domain-containing protein